MATAVLTNTPTVLSTAETETGWTGNGVSLDNEIFKQGSNSISSIIQAQANKSFLYYTIPSTNLTNAHLCMWWQNTAYGKLTATNAVQIYVGDGSNISYFTVRQPVGGSEGLPEYEGGWTLLVVDLARTPDQNSGSNANLAAVTRVGVRINYSTSPRNVVNNWLDHLYYVPANTPAYDVYGGTDGDEISLTEIAAADAAGGWGILQSDNGPYRMFGPIQVGDNTGINATYLKSQGQLLIAADGPVAADYYALTFEGNTTGVTDIELLSGVINSANNRYSIDASAANVNALNADGMGISGAGTIKFKSGQTVKNGSFSDCYQIDPNGATFESFTISNYSEAAVNGALLWPGGTSVKNGSFINCDEAIEITQTLDQSFDNLSFLNNTADVHLNNGGNSITVNNLNGSDAATYTATGGGVVTFAQSNSFTVKGALSGGILTIFDDNEADYQDLGTALQGPTATTGADEVYSHGFINNPIVVQFYKTGYEEINVPFTLTNSSQELDLSALLEIEENL